MTLGGQLVLLSAGAVAFLAPLLVEGFPLRERGLGHGQGVDVGQHIPPLARGKGLGKGGHPAVDFAVGHGEEALHPGGALGLVEVGEVGGGNAEPSGFGAIALPVGAVAFLAVLGVDGLPGHGVGGQRGVKAAGVGGGWHGCGLPPWRGRDVAGQAEGAAGQAQQAESGEHDEEPEEESTHEKASGDG